MKYIRLFENHNLAPNGNISNLNKTQWHIVRTPEFKNWFGDWEKNEGSKVLDENGEPKIMYHGSYNLFNEFNINAEKKERTNNFAGFYFADNKQDVIYYANNGNGYIYECFLNIRNPLIHKWGFNHTPSDKSIKFIEDKYKNKYDEIYLKYKLSNLKSTWWVSFMTGNDSTDMAIIDGFDGYFDGAHQICAFHPFNIKLSNNTTFDKKNNDIRK